MPPLPEKLPLPPSLQIRASSKAKKALSLTSQNPPKQLSAQGGTSITHERKRKKQQLLTQLESMSSNTQLVKKRLIDNQMSVEMARQILRSQVPSHSPEKTQLAMDVLRQSLPAEIDPYDPNCLDQRERVDVGKPKVYSDVCYVVIRFSPDYLLLIEDIELSKDNPDYHTRRTFVAWSIRRCKVSIHIGFHLSIQKLVVCLFRFQ